jgi:hypothetical protein
MSNDSWDEMIKDNMSDLKISYYTYSFENNKSIYNLIDGVKNQNTKQKEATKKRHIWYFDFHSKNEHANKL